MYIRNMNGGVEVTAASGDQAEIVGVKRYRRGDPAKVRIEARMLGTSDGSVIACAFWNEGASCDENGYQGGRNNNWRRDDDVSVEFRVKLPAGVKLVTTTVNGELEISGATSSVDATTVNGGVRARTSGGPIYARTVNGSIEASMGTPMQEDLSFQTVNGSVTVELPSLVDAELDMTTTNGSVQTDFPVTVTGRLNPRRLHAVLGKGGRSLELKSVNGDVRVRRAGN
jgi:DUF4097 and DUF4098 domain-containing protein YvlB